MTGIVFAPAPKRRPVQPKAPVKLISRVVHAPKPKPQGQYWKLNADGTRREVV